SMSPAQREAFAAPVGRGSGALPPVGNADTYAFAPGRNAAPQAALAARWLRERTDAYLRVRLRDGEPTGAVHVVSTSHPHSPVSAYALDLLRAEGHGGMRLVEVRRCAVYARYRLLTPEEHEAWIRQHPPHWTDLFGNPTHGASDAR